MKQTILSTVIFLSLTFNMFGQNKKKNFYPLWTFHDENVNIHGISLGFFSWNNNSRNTTTNGVKIEFIGAGILIPLIPQSPIVNSDSAFLSLRDTPLSESINGISLSGTGTWCDCLTNGVSIGLIGQINYQINGVSASNSVNFAQRHNGLQVAMQNEAYYLNGVQLGLFNYSAKTKGLQIGFFNRSKQLKGFQVGIWNVNPKRKLPLINWNFKKEPASI
jgi:hypothetical protein